MDQKRLPLFIAISVAILLVFQYLAPPKRQPHPAPDTPPATATAPVAAEGHGLAPAAPGPTQPAHAPPPANVPRVQIDAPRISGSISLLGARLDDLRLRDYHETVSRASPPPIVS